MNRIGFEAGPLSQWLDAGLTQAAFEAVLLETRHVKTALSAMTVKTDRKDGVGLPSCCGWDGSSRCTPNRLDRRRSGRCWLRKQLLGRLLDEELSIRGILRGFGLKVGQVTRKTFEARFGIW